MSEQYKRALRACYDGMLNMRRDEQGHELFCYTKSCFFGKDTWNETTKTHRGKLYYNAKEVNKPFTKIFNVDEVDDTRLDVVAERMKNEPYEVLDKANGHLFMMSCFTEDVTFDENVLGPISPVKPDQHVVFHTKGSLPNPENDLLNDDIKIFIARFGDRFDQIVNHFPNSTWMFEALVQHDKHTMYDNQVQFYGDTDTFILLAANIRYEEDQVYDPGWHEMTHEHLKSVASFVGCPVIHKYEDGGVQGTPDEWLDHTDREGYVIHFLNDHSRCKVKTKEYWQLRFKKDLTSEAIISAYSSGGIDRLKKKLPEEVVHSIINVIEDDMAVWYRTVNVKVHNIVKEIIELSRDGDHSDKMKEIFTSDNYTKSQKHHLAMVAKNTNWEERMHTDRGLRFAWKEYIMDSSSRLKDFDEELEEIVDQM